MPTEAISGELKVITVEDSSLIVDRVKGILAEIDGIRFMGNARSISEALDMFELVHPEVAILDIHLGSNDGAKNGINLLNILRKMYPELMIVMLTNFTDIHYRTLCKDYGADFFLDKSNDFDKIPETLNQIQAMKKFAE